MRVSDNMKLDNAMRAVTSAQSRQLTAAREASTGARIGAPSDDPVGAARLARIQAGIESTAAYRSSISTVQGDVELSESMLASAGDLFDRAQEIALLGANASQSATERSALANEVAGLRDQLVSIANSKGSLGYLFGGTSATVPFDATGTFSGNSNPHTVEIAQGSTMDAHIDGAKAFTVAGGRDVFADLTALENALTADDPTAVA